MGKINLGRVIIGGIVAGIIIDIFEFVLNGIVLAGRWNAVMASINRPPIGMNAIAVFNILGLVLGIAAVWTYAAIRPRLGEGPGTALIAALLIWVVSYVMGDVGPALIGIYPLSLTIALISVGLVEIVVATVVGAWLYREGEEAAQAREARV